MAVELLPGLPQRGAGHLPASLLWLRLGARGRRRASPVSLAALALAPKGGGGTRGAWAVVAMAWPLCGFSATTFFPPYKPTLCKGCVDAKAFSWPLASGRFSTPWEGRFYHQPHFMQEYFHAKMWISLKNSLEIWGWKEPCIIHPGYPRRCWH